MKENTCSQIRYSLLMRDDDLNVLPYLDDIKVITTLENCYGDGYTLVLVAINPMAEINAEDLLVDTGAYAVHEELTNSVVFNEDSLKTLEDIYCWEGANKVLIADLLTPVEKVRLAAKEIMKEDGEFSLETTTCKISKDAQPQAIKDSIKYFFGENLYSIQTPNKKEITIWWPQLIPDDVYNFVIIQEDEDGDDDCFFPINKQIDMYGEYDF